jgi:hypothetical protein
MRSWKIVGDRVVASCPRTVAARAVVCAAMRSWKIVGDRVVGASYPRTVGARAVELMRLTAVVVLLVDTTATAVVEPVERTRTIGVVAELVG